MNIIAELYDGHWAAWLEHCPQEGWGGDTAATAVSRLLEAHEIDPALVQETDASTLTRVEYRIATTPCPDCKGSGKYTGFNSVSVCSACGGLGTV